MSAGGGGARRSSAETAGARGEDIGRERLVEIQRARMLAAMVELAAERGAANVTVAHVVARSGVSRRMFYELFSDREDCFLAAFDDGIARIAREVLPAYEQPGRTQRAHPPSRGAGGWRERIRASLTALLRFLDYDPGTGRLVVVETLGAGARALERRQRVLAQIITAVDEGRLEAKKSDGPPPLTAEGVAGAVLSVIHGRLLAGLPPALGGPRMGEKNPGRRVAPPAPSHGGPRMGELLNPLMSMIVLPYLGPAAARGELERTVPRAPARQRPANGDPLRELGMRLTYRTIRVLMAVAARPGSSNRMVSDGAGITDQGQVSKLLHRLERLGLLRNDGTRRPRGGPNAWTLTEKGREVVGAIAPQPPRA